MAIITKNSNTGGAIPTAGQLQVGELAVNTADGVIYTKHTDSSVKQLTPYNFGFKNHIINGNFDIWQRGTSQTISDYGSDDRWFNEHAGSTKTHSRITCTDTERALFNAQAFSRTVVTSVTGAANNVQKNQRIEDVTKLAGKTVTLSFWAKANANKNIAFALIQVFGTGGTPSSSVDGIGLQKVALTTTWQKFTKTITLPSIVGKTLGTDGVHTSWTEVEFWFDAGTNFNSRTDSLGHQSGTFDIAQVQLEEGSVATPFEQRPIGLELSLCQRYCQTVRGTLLVSNSAIGSFGGAVVSLNLPQVMRATPSAVVTTMGSANWAGSTTSLIINFETPNRTGILVYPDGQQTTTGAYNDFRIDFYSEL
jgi:hypothetical protein